MSDHRLRAHARFNASGASRWMACPGSVRLCDGLPETKSSYALEGTQAHELLETMLLNLKIGAPGVLGAKRAAAPQDMMIDAVQIAFEYVSDLLDANPGCELAIEKKFELPSQAAPGEVYGTSDVVIYSPTLRKLWVLDYKHGSGVPVDIIGSKQLRFYALGALVETNRPVDKIEITIMQPRAFHPAGPIRSEVFDVAELVEFFGEIETAITLAQEDNAVLVSGDEQCRWCPAKTFCPAREKQALALVRQDFHDVRQVTAESLPVVNELSPDRIGHILTFKDLVEDWLDAVEKRGIELAKTGVFIPGRKLVEPVGRRTYNDASTAARKLADTVNDVINEFAAAGTPYTPALEADFLSTPEAVGVTEMDAKLKKLLRPFGKKAVEEGEKRAAFLTTKKSSGNLTLVADFRPATRRQPGTERVRRRHRSSDGTDRKVGEK